MRRTSFAERALVYYGHHFPIRRGKLRVINALWRLAVKGRDFHRIAHLKYGGFQMPCDISEMLQQQFYFSGTYLTEEHILEVWQIHSRHSRIIFDIGANAGIYSLASLAVRPDAVIHAFEPTPEIAERLRQTAMHNNLSQLLVHEAAVSSEDGRATLIRARGEFGTNEGMNYIVAGFSERAESVTITTLDRFCRDESIERIDLMKLDIQGHEHLALTGAQNLLKAGLIGMIFMELNWNRSDGELCPATHSVRLLKDAGYQFSEPSKSPIWREAGDWLRAHDDILASPVALDSRSVIPAR